MSSRFDGLEGDELEEEIQKQIEEKRIARENRMREAGIPIIPFPPTKNTNSGKLKRKSFIRPFGEG